MTHQPQHRKSVKPGEHRATIHQEKQSVLSDHECFVLVIISTTLLVAFHVDSPVVVGIVLTAASDVTRFASEMIARLLDIIRERQS